MRAEQKLQIDAIKGNRMYFAVFENFVFITDGHCGVYLKEKELKIDKAKMMQIDEKAAKQFDPQTIKDHRVKAKITNAAYRCMSGFAIKIKSTENETQCFVQEKFLKMFDGANGMFIESEKAPVYVERYGLPYGIILPIHVYNESE